MNEIDSLAEMLFGYEAQGRQFITWAALSPGTKAGFRLRISPLVRAVRREALEEAAKICDEYPFDGWDSTHEHYSEPNPAAAAIRALIAP